MSNAGKMSPGTIALIQGIAELGNLKVHAIYNPKGKVKYRPREAGISSDIIRAHLTDEQPIGCYFVIGELTQVAVIDFDDHDKSMNWKDMVEAAWPVVEKLRSLGLKPFCCCSGGGAGLHVWLVWERPQSAKMVKGFLRHLVQTCGFKHGTKGVLDHEVEVFPKNDRVRDGSLGNLVALPFARKSVPLDYNLDPIGWGAFLPPVIEELFNPDVTAVYDPPPPTQHQPAKAPGTAARAVVPSEVLPGDDKEVREALKFVAADDYDTWIKFAFAIKYSLGASSFEVWDEWSKTSGKYAGYEETARVWDGIEPDGSLTIGTVFQLAKERGWDGPSNPIVRDMNSRFGILTYGSTTRIILKGSTSTEVLSWLGKQAFEDRLAPEKFPVVDDNGNTTWRPKARYWLQHRLAAHYHELDFNPALPPGHNGHVWNMWRGFAVKAAPGDWSKLKDHIFHNICGGDQDYNNWMLNWMALGVQQPALVIGTAPVLRGLPGTGKGVLANAYGRIWMPHFVSITKDDHVRGRFNHHLEGRRFVYVDEAMFGGDRKNAGIIKTMLTEPQIMIERKGVDPIWLDNHMIFMVTSNERSVVPADIGDRRWQVFEVSDEHREDKPYFSAIMRQMKEGGYEAMLHELLERDISIGPDPRKTIRTPELFDQIIQAQGPVEKYIYQFLDTGCLPQPEAPGNGPGVTTIAAMYSEMKHSQPGADYVHETLFGRDLGKVFANLKKVQSGKFITGYSRQGVPIVVRSMRYHFPPLRDCRRMFEDYVGQSIPWSHEPQEWQGDVDPSYNYGGIDEGRETPF
ncbi:primase-like protein [Ruegeria sp. P4]|nr:primase-like protein [Ruegeria sp. P4]